MPRLDASPGDFRALAAFLFMFAVLFFYKAMGSPPAEAELEQLTGRVQYTETATGKGRSVNAVRFGLQDDPRSFLYSYRGGDAAGVLDALNGATDTPVSISFDATDTHWSWRGSGHPVYAVLVGKRAIRPYEEVVTSWLRSNDKGMRWGSGFLAAAVLLLLVSWVYRPD